MGYRYQTDGLCYECGAHTEYYCDHCMVYACEDHRVDKEIGPGTQPNSEKHFMFCEKCYKKGKTKPIDPYRHTRNPDHLR